MAQVNVNVFTIREVVNEVVDGLVAIGVLNADGTFNEPTKEQDVKLAVLAENVAVKFGVVVPTKVDRLIKMLPLLLDFVG